jgi:hypothetical protein
MKRTRLLPVALVIGISIVAAACGDDSSSSSATTAAPATTAAAGGATTTAAAGGVGKDAASRMGKTAAELYTTDLSKDCPKTLTVQRDWLAEVEHSAMFQMIGDKGKMSESIYEGPLGSTGITLKLIDGGPGVGEGQTIITTLFAGNLKFNVTPDLAYVATDDMVTFSKQFPVVGVVTPLDKSPQMIFWDPATYPNGFKTVADLKEFAKGSNKIYVGQTKSTFTKYFIDNGVPESAFLPGYAGDSEKFVTNAGKWLNQGYSSNEYFKFTTGLGWAKPLKYSYVSDMGFDFYPSVLALPKAKLTAMSPCLKKLVPIMQQAQVDYINDPTTVNKVLTAYNEGKFGASFWKTPLELNEAGAKIMKADGLVSNGSDSTLGNFDLKRVQTTIDNLKNSLDDRGNKAVTPADLVTNEFIDTSIGLK